jgi:uncharacterized protein
MTSLPLALSLLLHAAPVPAARPAAAPAAKAAAPTKEEAAAAQRAWHQERLQRLTAETGWLTLVGLHWLAEGESRLGSAQESEVRLPAGAPATLGTLTRKGASVSFVPAPGVAATVKDAPFTGGALRSDAEGAPDVVKVGTLQFHVISRGDRLALRVRDTASPARTHFAGIPLFPYDPAWRVEAQLVPGGPGNIAVPNVVGTMEQMPTPGVLVFSVAGKEYRLTPVVEPGTDELFIIFADETNRRDSYGAGRFLYAPLTKDGKTVLDFNRATNPPCAFTRFATCPLPPRANRLAVRVEAGEKRAAGAH